MPGFFPILLEPPPVHPCQPALETTPCRSHPSTLAVPSPAQQADQGAKSSKVFCGRRQAYRRSGKLTSRTGMHFCWILVGDVNLISAQQTYRLSLPRFDGLTIGKLSRFLEETARGKWHWLGTSKESSSLLSLNHIKSFCTLLVET